MTTPTAPTFRHREDDGARTRKLNELVRAVGTGGGSVDAFTVDGGNAATTYDGTLQVDFGSAT
jgi:hypothetical protein